METKIKITEDLFLRPHQRKIIQTEIRVPEKFTAIVSPEHYLLAKEGLLVTGGIFKEKETITLTVMNLNQPPNNPIASFSGAKNVYLRIDDEIADVLYIPNQ